MGLNMSFRLQSLIVSLLAFVMAYGSLTDVVLVLMLSFIRDRERILELSNLYINPSIAINIALAGSLLFTVLHIFRYFRGLKSFSTSTDAFLAKPMMFPCRTSHTRMFPKTHSFSYSYLLVGVPVGWKGTAGGMLSADVSKTSSPWYMRLLSLDPGDAWHTVGGDDYLDRGHVEGGLQEKLQNYLQSQGIDPQEYPYAYLLTAPRFLNYASNPVSIWNLYSSKRELKAFILEVNNTFDERHIYFVKPDVVPPKSPELGVAPKLIHTWPKDFYVSTFNSRAGNYSVSATDPLYPSMTGSGFVNTTITLKSAHVSLVARIFSSGPAIDPATMTSWAKTKFLMAWWWVGLATFPRTLVQAVKLLFMRKMQWVFRPEPKRNTMPRHADSTEVFIERIFRRYLRTMVEACDDQLVVNYSPAGLVYGEDEIMSSPAAQLVENKTEALEFKVLTPSFYSRFVHYSGPNLSEIFLAEQASGTIILSQGDLIPKLSGPSEQQAALVMDNPRFWAIQRLRSTPSPIQDAASPAPLSPMVDEMKVPDPTRSKPLPTQLSALESFILATSSPNEISEYASRVLKLFISEYLALGWMELLDLEIFLLRSGVAWMIAGLLKR